MKLFSRAVLAAAATAVFALSSPQQADAGVNVGLLKCKIDGGTGFFVGSTKTLDCIFKSNRNRGRRDRYVGEITKIGADIGFTEGATLVWAVFAPGRVHRGSLAGMYVGASGQATLGVGLGANVLIGGFDSSINLQPVSFQGQKGWNVAGGLAGLRLESH